MMECLPAGRRAPVRLRHLPFTLAAGALVAAVALVCGCGPVGSGGTGAPAGAALSGFSQGPINGFGSIIVNGVRFDDSNARVVDDDDNVLSASADLHLGTTVDVQAASAGSGAMTQIRVHDDLVGPVTTAYDATSHRIEVLGEAVDVDATTFVDGIPGGLQGLATGTVVEVSALYDPVADLYHATRIGTRPGAAYYIVRGAVAAPAGGSFRIGSQVFDYGTLGLPAGFETGRIVRIRLDTAPSAQGHWQVSAIGNGVFVPPDGGTGDLRGTVGAVVDDSHAYVAGVLVDASMATRAPSDARLADGALVVVHGTMSGTELIASRIDFAPGQPAAGTGGGSQYVTGFQITGSILTPVDMVGHTFGLRGPTTVDYATASFTGGSAADLARDRKVTVHGSLSADGQRLVAAMIAIGG
jgi:hypothetical protein